MESPRERRERISDTSAGGIDRFLQMRQDMGLTSFGVEVEGTTRVFMLIAPKGTEMPRELAETILRYQAEEVLPSASENVSDDCVTVAGEANKELSKRIGRPVFALSTQNRGEKIPFFKDLGYRHHMINLVELDEGDHMAFDLTSHYGMDARVGHYDVFALRSGSFDDLKRDLRQFYGTSWD